MKKKKVYSPEEIARSFVPREPDGSHHDLRANLIKAIEDYAAEQVRLSLVTPLNEE